MPMPIARTKLDNVLNMQSKILIIVRIIMIKVSYDLLLGAPKVKYNVEICWREPG